MQMRVKAMRERAGLTQRELADRLGVTQQSVYYYESGDRDIKASMLILMSEVLGCTVNDLLGYESADEQTEPSRQEHVELCAIYDSATDVGRELILDSARMIAGRFPRRRLTLVE